VQNVTERPDILVD